MATTTRKTRKSTKSAKAILDEPDVEIRKDAVDTFNDFLLNPDVIFVSSEEEAEELGVDTAQQLNDLKLLLHALFDAENYAKLVEYMQKKYHKKGVLNECYEYATKKLNVNGE